MPSQKRSAAYHTVHTSTRTGINPYASYGSHARPLHTPENKSVELDRDIVHNPTLPVRAIMPAGGKMAGTKKKERKEKKEKPLDKWTIKEIREECLKIGGIHGVHGMNKEELLGHLREAKGVSAPVTKKTVNVREIKAKVLEMRDQKKQQAQAGATRKQINVMRKKIARLKKQTRQGG